MGNLGPVETRKRMVFGVAMLALGVVLTVVFLFLDVYGPLLLVLFVPFWLGAVGIFQGREKT